MLIKEIEIINFKSFKHISITDLSGINMIYGFNNSGKSNLLKFIEIVFRRKIEAARQVKSEDDESLEQKGFGNWWEGVIENEPYIFRDNDTSNKINFRLVIGLPKSILFDILNDDVEEFRNSYIKNQSLKDATSTLKKVQQAIKTSLKDKDGKEEDLKKEADKLSRQVKSLELAHSKNDKDLIDIEVRCHINSLGMYDSEIFLKEVYLNQERVYNGNDQEEEYFEKCPVGSSLISNGYEIVRKILEHFNDSVLFLDNDRYFKEEVEGKDLVDSNASNFKNWIHNLSMNAFQQERYLEILSLVNKFKPAHSGYEKQADKNTPFGSINLEFARMKDKLEVILKNKLDKRFPIEKYGTGIQQVLYILLRIAEFKPKVILLEEIELNLSPMYQKELLAHIDRKLIGDKPDKEIFQIFFTSHSPLLSINSQYQILNVSINRTGESIIEKANQEKIHEFYPKDVIDALIGQTG